MAIPLPGPSGINSSSVKVVLIQFVAEKRKPPKDGIFEGFLGGELRSTREMVNSRPYSDFIHSPGICAALHVDLGQGVAFCGLDPYLARIPGSGCAV